MLGDGLATCWISAARPVGLGDSTLRPAQLSVAVHIPAAEQAGPGQLGERRMTPRLTDSALRNDYLCFSVESVRIAMSTIETP
jgi:hypothetical protein